MPTIFIQRKFVIMPDIVPKQLALRLQVYIGTSQDGLNDTRRDGLSCPGERNVVRLRKERVHNNGVMFFGKSEKRLESQCALGVVCFGTGTLLERGTDPSLFSSEWIVE